MSEILNLTPSERPAEVDHIVPVALAPELGNEIANLELMPLTLNRRKGVKVGARQFDYARRFRDAGLITQEALLRIKSGCGDCPLPRFHSAPRMAPGTTQVRGDASPPPSAP